MLYSRTVFPLQVDLSKPLFWLITLPIGQCIGSEETPMACGDHLYVSRGYGTYTHHGIDCGDGTVVHYKEGEAITRSSWAFFARGETVSVKDYEACDPVDLVLKRALSRLGERDYNVVFNNCEHFATWCKTGKHQSDQVDTAVTASLMGGVVSGVALGAAAFAVPALAAAGVYSLHKLVEQAQESKDPIQAQAKLSSALALIQTQRQTYETELDKVLREAYAWDCTARLALQKGRDDLARAALARKYPHKQKALQLDAQLQEILQLEQKIKLLHQGKQG